MKVTRSGLQIPQCKSKSEGCHTPHVEPEAGAECSCRRVVFSDDDPVISGEGNDPGKDLGASVPSAVERCKGLAVL